jgi:uncharacterized protein involved in exopolysaccharide biosynthesis
MLRYLDCFYRHRRLLVAMVALSIALSLGMVVRQGRTYEATARVWVDKTIEGDESNPYVSPADIGSGILSELLQTRSFCSKAGERSGLADNVAPRGRMSARARDELVYQTVSRQGLVFKGGPNVIDIFFRYRDPELAARTAQAVVDVFRDEVLGGQIQRAKQTVAFYQTRVKEAQTELSRADTNVADYLTNGAVSSAPLTDLSINQPASPSTASDPGLVAVQREDDAVRARADDLTRKLDQARLDLTIAEQSAPTGARLIDRPLAPDRPVSRKKAFLTAGVGGLVAGVLLSLLMLTALTAADTSVRYADEVEPALGLRVVGLVPDIT